MRTSSKHSFIFPWRQNFFLILILYFSDLIKYKKCLLWIPVGTFGVSSIVSFKSKNKLNKSPFIDEFKEDIKWQKVKFINEKKGRVTVLHIENLTKPLYWLFLKDLICFYSSKHFLINEMADFKVECEMKRKVVIQNTRQNNWELI